MQQSLKYWIWLSSLRGIGPKKYSRLLEAFGEPQGIWDASEDNLKGLPFLTPPNIAQLIDKKQRDAVEKHLEAIDKHQIKVVTIKDEEYPSYLKNIYDPPTVLYVKGEIRCDERAVAVVGSRKATPYGLSMAQTIAYELAGRGIAVVSGMARGIDSSAHHGALKAGGRTVAVLGCGLDTAYPPENGGLMEKIAGSGAVISEYLPGVPPMAYNFPARNRIISGIALGVVVVEASERSGSLITAEFALEHGREVFAVPGNLNNSNSRGTNRLIRDGAKIVTDMEDILEELKVFHTANNNRSSEYKNTAKSDPFEGLDAEERKIAQSLQDEPLHIDVLAGRCGFSVQTTGSLLMMLELRGVIEQMPGKIFKLK